MILNYIIKIVCKIKIVKHYFRWALIRYIISHIPNNYCYIYLIRHNIGESTIYLSLLDSWINAESKKKSILLIWNKEHIPLYNIFNSKGIDTLYLPLRQSLFDVIFDGEKFMHGGITFFCPASNIAKQLSNRLFTGTGINFFSYITKNFTKPLTFNRPRIPDQVAATQAKKSASLCRPFVVLCPEASTLQELSVSFWRKLAYDLMRIGYAIYVNTRQGHYNIESTFSFQLSISELYSLCYNSAGIISMASGISIFLYFCQKPMDILYTNFKSRKYAINSTQVLQCYSLKHIPFLSYENINEYDSSMCSETDIINAIIKRYNRLANNFFTDDVRKMIFSPK